MPQQNKDAQLNNAKKNVSKCTYFFSDRTQEKLGLKPQKIANKQLKNSKPIKYSTVFVVDKQNLLFPEEELKGASGAPVELVVLEEAKEKVENQKSNKSKWLNLAFFVLNIIILAGILIYQSTTFGVVSLDVLKENARFSILFFTILLFVVIMLLEALRTHILLYKATRQFRPFLCYKASAISRYYDCVTPFASGGQPFEIFYLNSRGVHGGIATSVPLTKAMYNNVAFILVSVIVLICNSKIFTGQEQNVIIIWGIISLCISCLILLILILFAISKRIMPKILMSCLRLGKRMHFVKDERVLFSKCMRTILEYQKSTKHYIANVWITLGSVLCSATIIIVKAFIPVMLYWAFHVNVTAEVVIEILSKFILVELATKYIPIPGGSGVAEISFSALFMALFTDGTLFWAMLFWRIMNYFIYLLQGMIVLIYDFAYGNKKNKAFKIKLAEKEQEILKRTKHAKINKNNIKQK